MKKPHEQEWKQGDGFKESACVVFGADGERVADLRFTTGGHAAEEARRARFIAVAPKMARALAKLVGNHDADCECGGCAALREAGVLE